jgi:hypothetical protein
LPVQASQIRRGVATDQIRIGVGASKLGCVECFLGCQKLSVPWRAACESLCAANCGQ